MAQAKKKKSEITNAQKVGIGVGLTAAAVAAAGTYFLYGSKNAPKNRKKVKGWALKAKGEVLDALEKAEHITEEEFHQLVDKVAKTYGKARNLSERELREFKKEMSENWQGLITSGATKVFTVAQMAEKKAKQRASAAPKKKSTGTKKKTSTSRTAKKKAS